MDRLIIKMMKLTMLFKNRYKGISFFLLILIGSFMASCDKMDDNYKDFVKGGEIVYTGRVDSLRVFPGRNRLRLQWLLVSDPKITRCKVFWNNRKDSAVIEVKKTAATDTIKHTISNLASGVYAFEVYSYDNLGHSSSKAEVTGTVYGDNYAESIFNRPLDSAIYHPSDKRTVLKWFGVSDQAISVEVKYTGIDGTIKTIIQVPVLNPNMPNDKPAMLDSLVLPGYKTGTTFTYRTGYKPVSTAMDVFYTDYTQVTNIILYVPPKPPDANTNLALKMKGGQSSGTLANLTDGDRSKATVWQPSSAERGDLNVWFYVDLASVQEVNKTQIYFVKDPAKITYHEVLYTDPTVTAIKDGTTAWIRAYIKFGPPEEEEINLIVDKNGLPVKTRFVKVNIGLIDSGANINVSEFEVYKKF
jgi:hypothetical protein